MVRLDKEIVIDSAKDKHDNGLPIKEVSLFSHKVLKKMENEGVPPTPYNFQIYFEAMLEKSDSNFKNDMSILRKSEASMDDGEHQIQIEKEMKEGFSSLKSMVKSISGTYKNVSMLKQYIQKTDTKINSTNNQIAITNIVSSLKSDINRFDLLISGQLNALKKDYEKTVLSLKSMESKAIYDTRYDVYNKKYLIKSIKSEKQAITTHNHKSSLMSLKIKNSVLQNALSSKNQFLLNKHIAKLLQKTSRRSDIVAHFGDGIFFMLLKHTNIDESKLACQRVSTLIYDSSFFVEGADVRMDLEIAVSAINTSTSTEECIATLLNIMPESSRDGVKFKVIEESSDEESFE